MPRQRQSPRKPGLLSAAQLRELMDRNNLRQADVAWMCQRDPRQVRAWCLDEADCPAYAALLLMAYDERAAITAAWLVSKLGDLPH